MAGQKEEAELNQAFEVWYSHLPEQDKKNILKDYWRANRK